MFRCIIFILLMGVSGILSAQQAVVRGIVVSYDSKKVVLSQRNGDVRIEVPRSAVAKQFKKLRTGQRVHAFLSPAEVIRTMKDRQKKKDRRKVFKKTIHN